MFEAIPACHFIHVCCERFGHHHARVAGVEKLTCFTDSLKIKSCLEVTILSPHPYFCRTIKEESALDEALFALIHLVILRKVLSLSVGGV